MPLGELLQNWDSSSGTPIYLGEPDFFGAEGDAALRRLTRVVRLKPLPRTLGGRMAEWVEGGTVLQRLKIIVLPEDLSLKLTELGAGVVALQADGLERGWQIRLQAPDQEAVTRVTERGKAELQLQVSGNPGLVRVLITDPRGDAALELSALWPARTPELIDPSGERLEVNRQISLGRLEGWRGFLPGKGALALRPVRATDSNKPHGEKRSIRVGFTATKGEVSIGAFRSLMAQVQALAGADGLVNCRLAYSGAETKRLEIGKYDWESDANKLLGRFGVGRTQLHAVNLNHPERVIRIDDEAARIDLAKRLGEASGLWFVQGTNERLGVMRPFVWSATALPPSTREDRIMGYAADWSEWLERPDTGEWKRVWELIRAVREGGDAGALDQLQALGRTPSAAAFLLFFVPRNERADALALELEAPIWWPLVRCSDWALGIKAARQYFEGRFQIAEFENPTAEAAAVVARIAGEVRLLRPELAAHLGHGLQAAGLRPIAPTAQGAETPLLPPAPAAQAMLECCAQEAGRRFDSLPEGVRGLTSTKLKPPAATNAVNAPLLHAPLVAAEAAAGLRKLTSDDILRLIALREIDSRWFEESLPAALTLALAQCGDRR